MDPWTFGFVAYKQAELRAEARRTALNAGWAREVIRQVLSTRAIRAGAASMATVIGTTRFQVRRLVLILVLAAAVLGVAGLLQSMTRPADMSSSITLTYPTPDPNPEPTAVGP